MAKRYIMRLELTGTAKKKLETLSDHHGMTQVAMMSRLVEFFASRDEKVQTAMLGSYPKEMQGDITKLIIKSVG